MYDRDEIEGFHVRMEEIIDKYEKKEAFELITSELRTCEDKYLIEFMGSLNFLKYEPVLEGTHQTAFPLTGVQSIKWLSKLVNE